MWAPHSLRTGQGVIVVTTDRALVSRSVTRKSELPVSFGGDISRSATKVLFPRSVRAAIHVHNGRHAHFPYVPGPTDVFLHHGDSLHLLRRRLPAATTPRRRRQARIERNETKDIEPIRESSGCSARPQTKGIDALRRSPTLASSTMLYAPTGHPTTPCKPSYSSLLLGALDRRDPAGGRPHGRSSDPTQPRAPKRQQMTKSSGSTTRMLAADVVAHLL